MKEIRISHELWEEVNQEDQKKIVEIIKGSGFFEKESELKIIGDPNIPAHNKVTSNIEVDKNEWFGCKALCDTAAAAATAACTAITNGIGVAACIAAANAAKDECRDRC